MNLTRSCSVWPCDFDPITTKLSWLRLFTQESDAEREVTLSGIQALAKNCPDLDLLTMFFDARLPEGGPPELEEPSICKLDELNVIFSPIEDPDMVSSFLEDCFPELKRFSFWEINVDYSLVEGWEEVQDILGLEDGGV